MTKAIVSVDRLSETKPVSCPSAVTSKTNASMTCSATWSARSARCGARSSIAPTGTTGDLETVLSELRRGR